MVLSHGELKHVDVESITLDRDNPRIRKWVEMYDDVTDDRLRFALLAESSDESQGNTTTVDKLKNSIKTSGSIIQPVLLNRKPNGALICIEGNTRVRLYTDFKKQEPNDERWNTIPAIVYDDLSQGDIDAIRLQVHLVGPRQWDPYSKAKYLAHLRNERHLPYSVIIDYAGGREREIDELITAYEEMEEYYRAILPDDGAFDTKREGTDVRAVLSGIKRLLGTVQKGKCALRVLQLRQVLNQIDDSLRGLRDRAILLVGFAGALRRSELVGLQIGDIELTNRGAILTIRRSKTDQFAEGDVVAIPRGVDPRTCPVAALAEWMSALGRDSGALFRRIDRHGRIGESLTGDSIARIVAQRVSFVGLDGKEFGAHSLRAGFVTEAASIGVAEHSIMLHTRHRSVATMRKYIRRETVWSNNACARVGL